MGRKPLGKSTKAFGAWADKQLDAIAREEQVHLNPRGLLTLGSWNTWAGCMADYLGESEHVVDYVVEQAAKHDIIGLYEVHRPRRQCSVRFAGVAEPKGRPGRLDLELGERIHDRLKETHRIEFVSHFSETAFHDCEATDEPVDYGNMVLIKKELCRRPYKISTEHVHIFGTGHLNSENKITGKGRPASRNGIIVTTWFRGHPISILFAHGLWTMHGKVDIPARTAQSIYMANAFVRHRTHKGIEPVAGANILMGDLNLQTKLEAMRQIQERVDVFGPRGGVNLLPDMDTRTDMYPADKATREANFVVISEQVVPWVQSCTLDKNARSDHVWTTLVIAPQ